MQTTLGLRLTKRDIEAKLTIGKGKVTTSVVYGIVTFLRTQTKKKVQFADIISTYTSWTSQRGGGRGLSQRKVKAALYFLLAEGKLYPSRHVRSHF